MIQASSVPLIKIDEHRWEIPQSYKSGMRVPGRIYADERLLEHIVQDQALEQVANVACLPGIVRFSLAMPDMHWGYGFPIGGVAATDPQEGGVISPGGVGFDINCGVRFAISRLTEEEVRPRLRDLVKQLFRDVPSGMGARGGLKLGKNDFSRVLEQGARWAVDQGYGRAEDLESTEDLGGIAGAQAEACSEKAYARGKDQLGTLGSGNHFLEVQVVDEIYDEHTAAAWGLVRGRVGVMIHCGSRGFGHQVCTDYVKIFLGALARYGIELPDRQLACAPVNSAEGREYLAAMRAAANFAFCNRQIILHHTRRAFQRVLGDAPEADLVQIYDVAHNIAKMESYDVDGVKRTLCVHRKGATRCFPAGHPALPGRHKEWGQPVLIPGDMGRFSYLLVGQPGSAETFHSTCHGAGRVMSRSKAKKTFNARRLVEELEAKGVIIQAQSKATIVEEASAVYKDAGAVVDVVHRAGLAKRVCRLRPIGVVKG